MARTALVFLSDGTLDRQPFRGPTPLYAVLQEAVTTRFPSYSAFHETWLSARRLDNELSEVEKPG